ncbi:hypothetical protein N7519_006869 [Penicillium mononematosum]|uniref:uncharacterized protein n=1 Tax=Penicillium mononematosum TaxID=268346 RepID=UPI002546D2EB|nr:uncharacterized protein N7519_006869 [Penicillium mononematosum]KAJ6185568.1 hypothetical protein N7519_006869 [Penicillium mononematosum]
MDKPTFVFSLGAWLTPIVFDAVRDRLNTLGYPSECPAHPSIGAEPPSLTLEDDVASLRRDKDQSLLGMLGGNYLPWMKVELTKKKGDYARADGTGAVGWQDLTVEQQEKWNRTTMHTSRAVFSGETTYEPWRDIPCSYIICEQDLALPPAIQEFFASKMGGPDTTHRLPSSHSPFLSMPDRLVGVLEEIVKV